MGCVVDRYHCYFKNRRGIVSILSPGLNGLGREARA